MDKATYEIAKKAIEEVETKGKDGRMVVDVELLIRKLEFMLANGQNPWKELNN